MKAESDQSRQRCVEAKREAKMVMRAENEELSDLVRDSGQD